MTEHETDMNITNIDKYKKTEHYFFKGRRSAYFSF